MSDSDELRAYEELLAGALTADDPVAVLVAASRDPAQPEWLRTALAGVAEDGVRISRLLVARLRFERLVQGSARASKWFATDPGAFTETFRRYHAEVPPTGAFAQAEARTFEAWLDEARGDSVGHRPRSDHGL